jgi:hypothetical protein
MRLPGSKPSSNAVPALTHLETPNAYARPTHRTNARRPRKPVEIALVGAQLLVFPSDCHESSIISLR